MEARLMDESCADFSAALAARRSVPGGGAAAAYCGALAAALCSMVGAFTVGKAAYAAHEAEVVLLMEQANRARLRMLELVEEDGRAFQPLARAYSLAADDPEREAALEEGALAAVEPPLAMMREVHGVIGLLEDMNRWGSALLRSDIGCGAAMAAAALLAASMNVHVNTRELRDRRRAEALEAECEELLAGVDRARGLAEEVAQAMKDHR